MDPGNKVYTLFQRFPRVKRSPDNPFKITNQREEKNGDI